MAHYLSGRMLAVVIAAVITGGLLPLTACGEADMGSPALPPQASDLTHKVSPRGTPATGAQWQKHGVLRMDGERGSLTVPALFVFISGGWDYSNAQMPYLVEIPEKRRLLLSAEVGAGPVHTVLVSSDDGGATWSQPRWMHTDAAGSPDFTCVTGLTYLGGGKLVASSDTYWFSRDWGQTWADPVPVPVGAEGKPMWGWDPLLVDRDPATGKVIRLAECRYKENGTFDTAGYFSQAAVHFSSDEGKTWSKEIEVPQWRGVSEVALVRARSGDLVAACRTDNPPHFLGLQNDQYSGLATSVSHDDGNSWSALNRLYLWGRHHPDMVVLPSGDIVMTYVVRNGYTDDRNGFPRFGVEAVISHDNGNTWDLDHKYILASWTAKIRHTWWGAAQSTSTVVLPSGALLTAFGTGLRNVPEDTICEMDVALVRWRPSRGRVSSESAISRAPFDSDLRNRFDLESAR